MWTDVYRDRRVLVTGDTGFLGGWTTRWLEQLGASVAGYSRREQGDIADAARFGAALDEADPSLIIHLAGSTTVAAGFRTPAETFTANVLGSSTVLDGALRREAVRAVVVLSTPAIGALDDQLDLNPYVASKMAVETVAGGYAHPATQRAAGRAAPLAIAVARPGVMVGGDWGEGRLLADVVRNVRAGEPVVLRAAGAIRPWQHVLEGVGGVLLLGARLVTGTLPRRRYEFGCADPAPVGEVVHGFLAALGVPDWPVHVEGTGGDRIELGYTAAHTDLGWQPVWDLPQALQASAAWYETATPDKLMHETIRTYHAASTARWHY